MAELSREEEKKFDAKFKIQSLVVSLVCWNMLELRLEMKVGRLVNFGWTVEPKFVRPGDLIVVNIFAYLLKSGPFWAIAWGCLLMVSCSQIPSLSVTRTGVSSVVMRNFVLFGGGCEVGLCDRHSNVVDTWNMNSDNWTVATLSLRRSCSAAVSVGKFALFGGGCTSSQWCGDPVSRVDLEFRNETMVHI